MYAGAFFRVLVCYVFCWVCSSVYWCLKVFSCVCVCPVLLYRSSVSWCSSWMSFGLIGLCQRIFLCMVCSLCVPVYRAVFYRVLCVMCFSGCPVVFFCVQICVVVI